MKLVIQRAYTIGLMLMMVCMPSLYAVANTSKTFNHINKVFHHRSPAISSLELGQLVFYFDQEAQVKSLPVKKHAMPGVKGSKAELVFIFPATKVSATATSMINTINRLDKLPYHAQVKVGETDVKLIVSYDPNQVAVEYEKFVAIDLQKGVTVRLYNKQVLDALCNKGGTMLRTASLKKKLGIVVDCGHGGADCGAISSCNLAEKDLTLSIGLQLADLLKADGYEVFLTRDADQTVALDERTTFANRCNADLFVSIHANHAPRKTVSGIETFCLNDALFKHCFADIDAPTLQCAHQLLHQRYKEGKVLAACVHNTAVDAVKKKYADCVDRSVKHAVTQVLLGTTMPAILIEVGFLSNPHEVVRLKNVDDQFELAQAMRDGIVAYDKSRSA